MGGSRWVQARVRGTLGRLLVGLGAVVLPVLVVAGTAEADGSFDSAEECIEAKPVDVDVMSWRCTSLDGSTWDAPSGELPVGLPSPGMPGGGSSFPFGAFVLFAVVWSAIPLLIAAWMAAERGESMGTAVLLTLLLGWIGLAIVYVGQSNSRRAVEGFTERASPAPATGVPPQRSSSPSPDHADTEARLRELDRLHASGLVGNEEYQQQRRRILDSI